MTAEEAAVGLPTILPPASVGLICWLVGTPLARREERMLSTIIDLSPSTELPDEMLVEGRELPEPTVERAAAVAPDVSSIVR